MSNSAVIISVSILTFALGLIDPVICQPRQPGYRIIYNTPGSKPSNGCFLVLKKAGKRMETLYPGDEISWSVMDSINQVTTETWNRGVIDFIGDRYVNINNQKVEIGKIRGLAMKRKSFHYKTGGKIMIVGGLVFLALDPFNRIINHHPVGISSTTAIAGSSFIGLGIVMQWIATKKYKTGDKFSLVIICP